MSRPVDNSDSFVIKKDYVDVAVLMLSGMIPQPLIAYAVMKMLEDEWSVFWWTIAAINVFYFVMWAIGAIITLVMFKLYFKKRLAEIVYRQLVAVDWPTLGADYLAYNAPEDIYLDMSGMEHLPCKVRIKATAFYCDFNNMSVGFLAKRRLNKAHLEALIRYSNENPGITYEGFSFAYED